MTADAVPDVPPDPPAADRDELARVVRMHRYVKDNISRDFCLCGVRVGDVYGFNRHLTDEIAGVLVDAADVRARTLEDAARTLDSSAREVEKRDESDLKGGGRGRAEAHNYTVGLGMRRAATILRGIAAGIRMGVDRAASEREGTT